MRTLYLGRMPESGKLTLKAQLASEVAHIRRARPEIGIVAIADGAADNWTFLETLSPETEVIDFGMLANICKPRPTMPWRPAGSRSTARSSGGSPWRRQGDPGAAPPSRCRRCAGPGRDRAGTRLLPAKHRHRMRYHALKEEGIAIGSGVVEAANKTLVTQRMKRSGMRWPIVGGQAVLTFRALIKSGRFERASEGPDQRNRHTGQRQHQSTCSSHGNRCLNSTNQAADITAMRDSHPQGSDYLKYPAMLLLPGALTPLHQGYSPRRGPYRWYLAAGDCKGRDRSNNQSAQRS